MAVLPGPTKPEAAYHQKGAADYSTGQSMLWRWESLPLLREVAYVP
jgi:hypothetical protein